MAELLIQLCKHTKESPCQHRAGELFCSAANGGFHFDWASQDWYETSIKLGEASKSDFEPCRFKLKKKV